MATPTKSFMSGLSAPARRALEHHRITSIADLKRYSEKELLALHGLGPSTIPILRRALQEAGATFRK